MAVIFFDFDSTVVTKETLDEAISLALAQHPERERLVREVEAITRLGMEGKLDFTESVRQRVAVVTLSKRLLEDTGRAMTEHLTPGMKDLFAWLEDRAHTYIVSGGFKECVAPTARVLGVPEERTLTNRFLFEDDRVVGVDETSHLWTAEGKGPALHAMRALHPDETFIMIGDGMNDYRAYEGGAADVFVGFGGNVVREAVRENAPHFTHSSQDLGALLAVLIDASSLKSN